MKPFESGIAASIYRSPFVNETDWVYRVSDRTQMLHDESLFDEEENDFSTRASLVDKHMSSELSGAFTQLLLTGSPKCSNFVVNVDSIYARDLSGKEYYFKNTDIEMIHGRLNHVIIKLKKKDFTLDMWTRFYFDPVAEQHFKWALAYRLCLRLFDGLSLIHREGITHGDLKLNNIMFDSNHSHANRPLIQTVQFLDFGESHRTQPEKINQAENLTVAKENDWRRLAALLLSLFFPSLHHELAGELWGKQMMCILDEIQINPDQDPKKQCTGKNPVFSPLKSQLMEMLFTGKKPNQRTHRYNTRKRVRETSG